MTEHEKPMMPVRATVARGLIMLEALFQELKMDVHLDVEVIIDDTDNVRLLFSGYTGDGVRVQQIVTTLPGTVRREIWNEGLRSYEAISGNLVEGRLRPLEMESGDER